MKKISKVLFDIYFGIGVVAIGILAVSVIFTVIMRYLFSMNWKEVSEFNILLFAFTTFWGMGINVIKNEHVVIDIFYDRIKPAVKRWVAVFNYLIVLAVDGIFVWYSIIYVNKAGVQISAGLEIPMKFMYGVMPVAGILCAICVIIKIVGFLTAPLEAFERQNVPIAKEKGEEA
ncbi:MAG TPA: TRAP transporter small permease [Candidatus Limiplasma sp.]|nr:TRAP transporter small permease [Candidatus Limiplasma sp.]